MKLQSKMTLGLMFGIPLLLCAGAAGAQIYQWKDAKGVTHFSDTPPPSPVSAVRVRPQRIDAAPAELPFQLAEALKNHPVTLYTTGKCGACDQGRAMLQARGIPYVEKTVTSADDLTALKQAGGADQLPMLLVGAAKHIGFERGAWHAALTLADYPLQRMLPPGFPPSPPSPAAAPRQPFAEPQAAEALRDKLPPVNPNPDFQF